MSHGLKALVVIVAVCITSIATAQERGFYVGASLGKVKQDVDSQTFTLTQFVSPGLTPVPISTTVNYDADTNGVGWNATVGYRINRFIAAELAYADFGDTHISPHLNVTQPLLTVGNPGAIAILVPVGGFITAGPVPFAFAGTVVPTETTVNVTGPIVSALGSLPITENLSAFLRVGMLFADEDVTLPAFFRDLPVRDGNSIADEVWLGGIGAEWSFANQWSGRLEYQRTADIAGNAFVTKSHLEQYSLTVLFRFGE
jgi:opacity protein-like surface antigen